MASIDISRLQAIKNIFIEMFQNNFKDFPPAIELFSNRLKGVFPATSYGADDPPGVGIADSVSQYGDFYINQSAGTVWTYVPDTGFDPLVATPGWVKLGAGGSGPSYTLPIASAGTLGGIKVGSRLSIDGSGVLSADVQSASPGGSTTQIQFNSAGAFAGDADLTWDNLNKWIQFGGAGNDGLRWPNGSRLYESNWFGTNSVYASPRFYSAEIFSQGYHSYQDTGTINLYPYGTNLTGVRVVPNTWYASGDLLQLYRDPGATALMFSVEWTGKVTAAGNVIAPNFIGNASTATALSTTGASGKFWGWDNAWHSFIDNEIPSGAIDSSNVTYTLANTPVPLTSLGLYLNGARLRPTTDYTITGPTVTMVVAPTTGQWLYADYRI